MTSNSSAPTFLALHQAPSGFVIPNAWDGGSARILEQVGFPAIATTSAGIAWSCGVPDGGTLELDTMLEHVGRRELLDPGTLGFLDGSIAYADLQGRFAQPIG